MKPRGRKTVWSDLLDFLISSPEYQIKSPGITTNEDDRNRTVYIESVVTLEDKLKPNLRDGQELSVTDVTNPSPLL